MAKIKDKDRVLKAAREKRSPTKENTVGYHQISQQKTIGKKGIA